MGRWLTFRRRNLLRRLEHIIGQCYNPHSTTAIAYGRYYEYGREFNYSPRFGSGDSETKWYNERKDRDGQILKRGRCKFGANHMYVYQNLEELLLFLEKEFDISFDELHKKRYPNFKPPPKL